MKCPYCGGAPIKVYGSRIYKYLKHLHSRRFWLCVPCDAYVGCHVGSDWKPLGRLANAALRKLKIQAHTAFDPLWKTGSMTRTQAYAWLADQMRLQVRETHIGYFDNEQCREVIKICSERNIQHENF